MKIFKLLVLGLFAVVSSFAQKRTVNIYEYKPNVIITGSRADSIIISNAVRHYFETRLEGFQQAHLPQFIISDQSNRFLLGIGGFANFRTAYDLGGVVQNKDFVTYDIPVPGRALTSQQLRMDASTSRIFIKSIANTGKWGRIITYIDADFRGRDYGLRLRSAYISFKGWLFGRDATTFCDLDACPTTVDFAGPNAYTYTFNTQIRYSHAFGDRWAMGIALEMPSVSGTYSNGMTALPQRMPDIPVYVQYSWGKDRFSHIRASAIFRDMYYRNETLQENKSAFGWGTQLSTTFRLTRPWVLFGQALYGEGISPYIQDISDEGLDIVPDPENTNDLQTLPMFGWFGAMQVNLTENLFCSGGYSQVRLYKRNDFGPAGMYRTAQYVFGNLFYHIAPHCQVAMEYLYGRRQNMNDEANHAHRLQAMIQYNF